MGWVKKFVQLKHLKNLIQKDCLFARVRKSKKKFKLHREKTGTFFVRRVLKRFLYYFLNLFRSIWQTFFACSKLSENRLSPDDLCVERRTKNVRNQSSEIRIRSVRFAFELTYQFGTDTPLSVFYELARVIRIRCQSQYL